MSLNVSDSGRRKTALFFLHYLGGSAESWRRVTQPLEHEFRCVAIDLPGFGDAAGVPGYSVAAMAERVAGIVRAESPERWLLAGHSMGAKVAATLARRAEDGEAGLAGLAGLILIAGSPPGPEPMDEDQRRAMLNWFTGDAQSGMREAAEYIRQNSFTELDPEPQAQAVADVLRTRRAAWVAWLESGSREDCGQRVGILQTPALLLAGEDDGALGPEAQSRLMAPHFAHSKLLTLPRAKHLLPMEYPREIAQMIRDHAHAVAMRVYPAPVIDANYRGLIESPRVGSKTRAALLDRTRPDDMAYTPVALSLPALATLRAVLDRVLPQPAEAFIDIAARIDARLGSGRGDGWRRAELPADPAAFEAGLQTLSQRAEAQYGRPFIHLDPATQDGILARVFRGELDGPAAPGAFDANQLRLWFTDARAEAVRIYVSHPATLDRMGYSGIANGGDGLPKTGFVRLGAGRPEDWEPPATWDPA